MGITSVAEAAPKCRRNSTDSRSQNLEYTRGEEGTTSPQRPHGVY